MSGAAHGGEAVNRAVRAGTEAKRPPIKDLSSAGMEDAEIEFERGEIERGMQPGTFTTVCNTSGSVNLRARPSTKARIVRMLPARDVVEVIQRPSGGWAHVEASGSSFRDRGYVRTDFLCLN